MASKSILVQIREFFGMDMPSFRKEWAAMSDADKADLKAGVENGTLTY